MYFTVVRHRGSLEKREWRFHVSDQMRNLRIQLDRYALLTLPSSRHKNWVLEEAWYRIESEGRMMLPSQLLPEPPRVPDDVREELRAKLVTETVYDFN